LSIGLTILLLTQSLAGRGDSMSKDKWPDVRPFEKQYIFADGAHASIHESLLGSDGTPLYSIDCHTFLYDQDSNFQYSGDFECKLASLYSQDAYTTLFTDDPDQDADWQSRARFLGIEVVDKCGSYPEFGRTRHFSLRGMEITLEISGVKLRTDYDAPKVRQVPAFEAFKFLIRVQRGPSATGGIAASVPYSYPRNISPDTQFVTKLMCDKVVRHK